MPGSLYDTTDGRDEEPVAKFAPTMQDHQELEQRISQVMEAMYNRFEERLRDIDEKLENYEQQMAILAMAYAEAAVMIESLIGQLKFATDEEREVFHKTMQDSRKHMVEVMTNHVNMESEDNGTETPMESMDETDGPTTTD